MVTRMVFSREQDNFSVHKDMGSRARSWYMTSPSYSLASLSKVKWQLPHCELLPGNCRENRSLLL